MPLVDVDEEQPLLNLACRLVSFDLWLTTHVDPSWKIKQVKGWFLSRCLNIPFEAAYSSASRAALSDAVTSNQQTATPPGQRYRPASPITFAPDPRRRPISPILFAKGGKGKEKERKKAKAKGKVVVPADTTSASVDGYEEDDEAGTTDDDGESFDEAELYRPSPGPPLPAPPPPSSPPPPTPVPQPSEKWTSKYNLSPSFYTLIRYSTGQILEDDLTLAWCGVAAGEILELHPHGDIIVMPEASSSTAAAAPHATTSEHGHGGHNRNPSIYSLASSPPPGDTHVYRPIHRPQFNRASLETYILPYWESPVRELRSVPVHSFTAPMPNFLNGYGYGYGGAEVNQRAIALGIGHPPPFGLQQPLRGGEGWDAKVGSGMNPNVQASSRIEWRPRHIVIKEGLLTLCVSREDTNPRHIIPLDAFTSLNGSEQLISYLHSQNQSASFDHHQSHPHTHPHHTPTKPFKPINKHRSATSSAHPRHSTSTIGPVFSSSHSQVSDSDSDIGSAHPSSPRYRTRTSIGSDRHDGDTVPRTAGGELIDDLHIICLRFRTADRLKRVPRTNSDGLTVYEYIRDPGTDKERERQRELEGAKAGSKKQKDKRGKGKGVDDRKPKKGKGFPWGDGKVGKKEKEKRDWIPGFSGKKDRDVGEKEKEKDRDRDRDRGGLNLGGMGMGVSLGLGLSGGIQDTKEQMAREREHEHERERAALSEADAEASITFAKRSDAGLSSDEDAEVATEEDGSVDEGEDVTTVRKPSVDKGKTKALEHNKPDSDIDSPISHPVDSGAHSMSSHLNSYTQCELASIVSGGEEGSSDAWSSPVFAQDSTDLGSDGDWSDIGGPSGRLNDGYRHGYRYGYQGLLTSEGGITPRAEPESVHEEEDRLEKERANLERRRQKEHEKKMEEEQIKENAKTEWIILDMGSDLAYSSFLRVLHRHMSLSASSSFLTKSSATPTPTPFPSPTSPQASTSTTQTFQWLPSSDEDAPTSSLHPHILENDASHDSELLSPISASSRSDRFKQETHPPDLVVLSRPGKDVSKTFGVLPYPEWRAEVTERAQRAGMGYVGRAMNWIKWGRTEQLALDVEELLRRHGERDDVSAESIRKKKREATSLKNRRRSTTSTVTRSILNQGGPSDKALGSTYESDFSEDIEKMLEMSDSEEVSEAEWHGWNLDLGRQREVEKKKLELAAEAAAEALLAVSDDNYNDHMSLPGAVVDDGRRPTLLEANTVISVRHPQGTGVTFSHSTPSATLYSPSSSDSLYRRATSFSPDRSSSPAGTSTNSHNSYGQSTSPLGTKITHKHVLPSGFSLSHSTSMYSPALRSDASVAEQNLRRPSMPSLTPDQTSSLYQGPALRGGASVLRSPVLSSFSFPPLPPPPTHSPPFSPTFSSAFPVDEEPSQASSTQPPLDASTLVSVPRRASSAGLINSGGLGGSLGRSTSVITRSGLLRKDAIKEAERVREKERRKEEKAREKEDKAREKERIKDLEREAKEVRKLQRPKLSLATSSTHQLVPQPATSMARSNARSDNNKALMRRVKSGSNLNEEAMTEDTTVDGSSTPHAGRKKRGVLISRFVRGLDSAMDFGDGR